MTARHSSWPERYPDLLAIAAVVLALLFGLYARFRGVAIWPLADDEYHTTESVASILKNGVPSFECGGYYVRGILYQYLLAILSIVTSVEEVTLFRNVTVVSNLLCLPPLYLMARKCGGRYLAWGSVVLFMLSVWEVEYSRYIRMYAPFQAVFVWYLYFLFRILVERDDASFKWIYILSVISVLIYEAGAFLVLLNFFPVLSGRSRVTSARILLPAVILSSVYYFVTFNFRYMGIDDHLPKDLVLEPASNVTTLGNLILPNTFLQVLPGTPGWYGAVLLLLVFLAAVLYKIFRDREACFPCRMIFPLWILLAVLNLYGLIIYSAVIFWLLGWVERRDLRGRAAGYLLTALLATAGFWTLYAYSTDAWHVFFTASVHDPQWKIMVMFLKYPNVLDKIYYAWMAGIPVTGWLAAVLVIIGLLASRGNGDTVARQYLYLLVVLVVVLCLLVGITVQPYNNSRYTFFLYPMVMLLVLLSIYQITKRLRVREVLQSWLFVFLAGGYIAFADDYDFSHLTRIDSVEINYRMDFEAPKRFHLFSRLDFRTPAEYVNERLGRDDIVIASVRPAHHYLGRLDYFLIDRRNPELSAVSACHGEKEIWTNAGLLYSEQVLQELTEGGDKTVWLLIRSNEYPYAWQTEKSIASRYPDMLVYKSVDRSIAVYRFDGRLPEGGHGVKQAGPGDRL